MKGKILISIVALGASSVTLANGSYMATAPAAAAPNYFDGFVVGVDGSMQHLNGNAQDSVAYDGNIFSRGGANVPSDILIGFNSNGATSLKTDIGDNTLGGGVFAGYGKVFNSSFYLGGEVYARYAHNTVNVNTSQDSSFTVPDNIGYSGSIRENTSMDIDSDWSFGGALKLGYLVTPKTMIYLLAGIEYSRFEVNVSHNGTDLNIPGLGPTPMISPLNVTNSYSFAQNKAAFVPGVGIETMLSDKLSLKAEYTYADYGELSHNENGSFNYDPHQAYMSAAGNIHSEDKVDLKRGLFTVGLGYHFNGI